jgi:exoribonuclease R
MAERDMLDLKKAALMAGRLGEKFEGVVTGAAEQGIYVTLDHPFVEGLVPGRDLPPGASYDGQGQTWRSGRGEPKLGIGERLQVQLVAVDPLKGWINFRLLGDDGEPVAVAGVRRGRPRARPAHAKAAPNRGRGRRRRS